MAITRDPIMTDDGTKFKMNAAGFFRAADSDQRTIG
jgi:hypothetical protein